MANVVDYMREGSRIFITSMKSKVSSKKYEGNATDICYKIVEECWNGRFFQTSTSNFPQFWTRDFGWVVSSLMNIGYKDEVQQTLRYAMNIFRQDKKVTTTISPKGKPFDFPTFSIDSLPWLIHSLKVSKFPYYSYKSFLNWQIMHLFREVIDEKTGLVKKNKHYSSMKDFAIRNSSCYDNCMIAMLASDLKGMKLINPFKDYNYKKIIKQNFWNGHYFYDDLNKKDYVAGDANLFPLLLNIVTDHKIIESVIKYIGLNQLDVPFPLKYTSSRRGIKFIPEEMFLRNYESNSIWTHMGPLYIKLVKKVNPELYDLYKNQYKKLIEHHKNYLEVFDSKGKPFKTPFYKTDQGMIWAANYITL